MRGGERDLERERLYVLPASLGSPSLFGAVERAVRSSKKSTSTPQQYVLPLDRPASYDTPFSAAIPLAFAIASAMLTEPEFTGLMLLRSRLPELLGCGKEKPPSPVGWAPVEYEGG